MAREFWVKGKVQKIATKKYGMIKKGAFGPSGCFGKKYCDESYILSNFLGVIKIKKDSSNDMHPKS